MKLDHPDKEGTVLRFAAESYMEAGGNPIVLLGESTEWLYDCYCKTGDAICIDAALQIIKTYMNLGLAYDARREIFDAVLNVAGTNRKTEFSSGSCSGNMLKKKFSDIREVLGYWPYAGEDMLNADEVAKDILEKVRSKQFGRYDYTRGRTKIFQLLILTDSIFLLDLNKNKVYTFV